MYPGLTRTNIKTIACVSLAILIAVNAWAAKVCPQCKGNFDDSVNFCPYDGKALKQAKGVESGRIELSTTPADAAFSIDGISRGKGPTLVLDLPVGEHRLEVKADGYFSQGLKFSITASQTQKFSLELVRQASEKPANPGASPAPTPQATPSPAKTDSSPLNFSNMIEVKGGSVLLGSDRGNPDERPLRRVKLKGFLIDRHEVTCVQYKKFLDAVKSQGHLWCHPCESLNKDHTPFHTYAWALRFSWMGGNPPADMQDYPVVLVDWFDAFAYARWAGKRLPNEDEWEVAAGGGDGREYPWGKGFDEAKCNVGDAPVRVGLFPDGRSTFGVDDMAGNVAEWTNTVYEQDARDGKPFSGRFGQPVIRGGSWDDESKGCRVSARDTHRAPNYRSTTVGFRCVADLLP